MQPVTRIAQNAFPWARTLGTGWRDVGWGRSSDRRKSAFRNIENRWGRLSKPHDQLPRICPTVAKKPTWGENRSII